MFGISAGTAALLGAGAAVVGTQLMGSGNNGASQVAAANQQISADTLAWYKQQDAEAKPLRDAMGAKALEVADQQLASSKTQDAIAADYNNYNKTTFRPLEQGLVAEATAYDTPARRAAAAESSMADVNKSFAASNDARARNLAANGINPGSARAMAAQEGQGVAQATADAGAAYTARKGVETTGHAMQMDAASLGRGLASSQATSAGLAITAGNSAVANASAPVNAANAATSTYGQGFQTAINGNASAGSLYNGISSNNNSTLNALGNAAGSLYAMSDENVKTDIADASDEDALAAVNKTPVKNWKYDPAKMAQRGLQIPPDASGENTGPMAQDVNATMGESAAPDGTKINLVTMNGVNMKATQAVDKKVKKLEKQVGKLSQLIKSGHIKVGA